MTIQNLKSQNLILLEVISGSKSFGLATPTSDTDIKGVYYLPKEKFFGLDYIPKLVMKRMTKFIMNCELHWQANGM